MTRSLVGGALGTVIVSLQQTPEDGVATLRAFSCLERFLGLLLRVINLQLPPLVERSLLQPVEHEVRGWGGGCRCGCRMTGEGGAPPP